MNANVFVLIAAKLISAPAVSVSAAQLVAEREAIDGGRDFWPRVN
jgi:hypothetical protein